MYSFSLLPVIEASPQVLKRRTEEEAESEKHADDLQGGYGAYGRKGGPAAVADERAVGPTIAARSETSAARRSDVCP